MSEAPKKIWIDLDYLTFELQPIDDSDAPYIRADIVDELVDALEELMYARTDKAENMAEAALKKLEQSND
jgi:hypothetical protein